MKIQMIALFNFFMIANAHADTCADSVKSAVEQQAAIDFPSQTLMAVVPSFRFDGGFVQSLDVPVEDRTQKIIATYTVSIDEVCSVEIQSKE